MICTKNNIFALSVDFESIPEEVSATHAWCVTEVYDYCHLALIGSLSNLRQLDLGFRMATAGR